MDLQTCSKCGQSKPVEAFSRSARAPSGYLRQCKDCKNAYLREYLANSEDQRRKARKRQWEWRQDPENRAYENAKGYDRARQDSGRQALASRKHLYKKLYGITIEEYDQMVIDQGGGCYICKSPPSGKHKYFHVDHCHTTGQTRKLLCSACNTGLGCFQDSIELLLKAAAYLEAHAIPSTMRPFVLADLENR